MSAVIRLRRRRFLEIARRQSPLSVTRSVINTAFYDHTRQSPRGRRQTQTLLILIGNLTDASVPWATITNFPFPKIIGRRKYADEIAYNTQIEIDYSIILALHLLRLPILRVYHRRRRECESSSLTSTLSPGPRGRFSTAEIYVPPMLSLALHPVVKIPSNVCVINKIQKSPSVLLQ